MRYFALLNIQHYIMFLFPTIAFIALFAIGLGYYHVRRKDSAVRETRIIEKFPGGIEGRNAPFPVIVTLILAGTVTWVLAYIILIGVLEVRI
jgi:hypothetical protein